jgi:hypothetical protein
MKQTREKRHSVLAFIFFHEGREEEKMLGKVDKENSGIIYIEISRPFRE